MPEDCGTFDFPCQAEQLVASSFANIAQSAGEAASQMIAASLTWWINTDSVNPHTDVVRGLQQYTVPVALVVLTGSVLVQAIRMVLSRKKDPAINVGLGLIRYAVVTTVGLGLLAAALKAGDDFSVWLVEHAIADFSTRMQTLFGSTAVENPFLLLVLAGIGVVLGAVQWLLGFIRQAGILVLAVMLPLAASGSINDSTKVWLNRLLPWLISLVLYKPMAAMIYTIGLTMMSGDTDPAAGCEGPDCTPASPDFAMVMTGLMVMVLAVLAMPAMLRFFSWSQVSATGGSGAGGVLAAGATGAASMAALRSARSMAITGPGSAGPSGATGSPGPAGQLGPGGTNSSGPAGGGPPGGGSAGGGGAPAATGAGGAPEAGTASARAGAGVPSGAAGGGAATGGAAAGGAGAAGAGAGGAAAAAGPAGAAVAGGAAVARGAYQAGQAAADGFTQGGEQK